MPFSAACCCLFGRPFVKRFALYYRSVVYLTVLSVTLVYCGRTVGWIKKKLKLGMEVGLGPGHIVSDGDPAPPKRGTVPNFRAMSIVAKRSPISATAEHLFRWCYHHELLTPTGAGQLAITELTYSNLTYLLFHSNLKSLHLFVIRRNPSYNLQ